jgi:K+-transporting ATPase KdpF subunit
LSYSEYIALVLYEFLIIGLTRPLSKIYAAVAIFGVTRDAMRGPAGVPSCSTRCFSRSASAFSPAPCFTSSHAIVSEEHSMIFDYALSGAVMLGLLVYLVYALTRPERF